MNIKALIATIVLGSSSVALADPMIRDHRTPQPVAQPIYQQPIYQRPLYPDHTKPVQRPLPMPLTWVTLANDAKISGRTVIKVEPTQRKFTKLELRSDGNGRASIDKVTVVFGNGRSQVVTLDTKLSKRQPSLSIDLNGDSRTIERIVVVGRTDGRKSSLDVLAI